MADEFEGSGEDTAPISQDIPQEVSDNIDRVFSQADEKDVADANTGRGDLSGRHAARANSSARAHEAADELAEDGLVNEDGSDDDGETPTEAPEHQTQNGTEKAATADATQEKEAAPELDPMHRMAANELGWTDAKIDEFLKANPEAAQSTFDQLARTYANLSRQMFAAGPLAQPQAAQPQQPAQGSPTTKLDEIYSNLAQFAEMNGQGMTEYVKALKAEVIDPVREIMATAQEARKEAMRTEATSAIGALSKGFSDIYGAEDQAVTPTQQMARQTLIMWADNLRAAARFQGREMSVTEALKRAHFVLTADQRDAIVRKEINSKVQKRSRQLTARPSQRVAPTGQTRGRESALAVVERWNSEHGDE